jgi:single-stranded-DNA-specific exonuclease
MTISESDVEGLRDRWIERARDEWGEEMLVKRREYELELSTKDLTMDLLRELQKLEPFGMANQQPIIRVGPLELDQAVRRFGRGHLSALARGGTGATIGLLGWGWQDRIEDLTGSFEVLGCLELDRYRRQPTLRLIDARPWSGPSASE